MQCREGSTQKGRNAVNFTLWMAITWAAALGIVIVVILAAWQGYCDRNK